MIPQKIKNKLDEKVALIEEGKKYLNGVFINPSFVNPILARKGEEQIRESDRLSQIVKRSNIQIDDIHQLIEEPIKRKIFSRNDVVEQIEIDIKYEGYINRQQEQVDRFIKQEDIEIPDEFDFASIPSLSVEGKERLICVKPRSI